MPKKNALINLQAETRNNLKELNKRFSDFEKKFDDLDQKLFEWKSEIHDLIINLRIRVDKLHPFVLKT